MTDHDPFDDELRARLSATDPSAADPSGTDPAGTDPAARLDELRPRFRAARRRRQQRGAALGSAAALLLFIVGVAVLGGGDDQSVDVADSRPTTTSSTQTTVPETSTSAAPDTTTSSVPGPTTTAAPGATTTSLPGADPTVPAPTVPGATTTTAPVGGRQVLRAEGGTATVVWTATSLRVESTQPAAGWEHEATEQKSPTRIEVRFRRSDGGPGSSSSTIGARVVDGSLVTDD